jgi:hypothetical protein
MTRHNGNYCPCGKFCFDEQYCEACKEHIHTCNTCSEYVDYRDLQDVFKHEHKDIPLTGTGYIKPGIKVK